MVQEEMLQEIQAQAGELTRRMHMSLSAEAQPDESGVKILFSGRDVDLLLQKNAAVLYAMEYLLNRMLGRTLPRDQKIVLDADDFRNVRSEELRLLAIKASEKVVTYGRPVDLQPMPPHERRIIHLALQDQGKVRTVSEGMGENRKVVIYPA